MSSISTFQSQRFANNGQASVTYSEHGRRVGTGNHIGVVCWCDERYGIANQIIRPRRDGDGRVRWYQPAFSPGHRSLASVKPSIVGALWLVLLFIRSSHLSRALRSHR